MDWQSKRNCGDMGALPEKSMKDGEGNAGVFNAAEKF